MSLTRGDNRKMGQLIDSWERDCCNFDVVFRMSTQLWLALRRMTWSWSTALVSHRRPVALPPRSTPGYRDHSSTPPPNCRRRCPSDWTRCHRLTACSSYNSTTRVDYCNTVTVCLRLLASFTHSCRCGRACVPVTSAALVASPMCRTTWQSTERRQTAAKFCPKR